MRRISLYLLCLLACALVAGCGSQPQPNEVATVSGMEDGKISLSEYQAWNRIASRSNPGQSGESTKQQVMRFLISARWLEGQAAQQDIQATPAQIKTALAQQSRSAFKTEQQKKQFLTKTGMTESRISQIPRQYRHPLPRHDRRPRIG